PFVAGGGPGGTATVGGVVLGAMPVVAGGLASSRAVRVFSPPAKTSARMTMTNTAAETTPTGWRCRLCARFQPGAPCPFYDRSLWDRSWGGPPCDVRGETIRKVTA